MSDPVRWAMVGGGEGAFIGAVHRAAASLDCLLDLRAAALSSDPDRAKRSAYALRIPADRAYGSWRELLDAESLRPANDRVELVTIVTPNNTHHEIARAAIDRGFHIVIDKPMTVTVEQAQDLVAAADRTGVVAAVTYNYSGYPMVREAAAMVRAGVIGDVRRAYVEYHQGWLATDIESAGQKQASWRTDPARAGAGGAIGDIGVHAEHLLRFITGLDISELCADLASFIPGRRLDDDAAALLRLSNGARASLTASQVCIGEENNFSIRVHGDRGSIAWRQEDPDRLHHTTLDGPRTIITRGSSTAGPASQSITRLPSGHPEGFIEAFANVYRDVARAVIAARSGVKRPAPAYPTFRDGLRGVRFVERMLASAASGGWVRCD